MTEKISRRGIRIPAEYLADTLDQVLVSEVASRKLVALRAEETVGQARQWFAEGAGGTSHQGFPVLNERAVLVGVLTRRDIMAAEVDDRQQLSAVIARPPKFVYQDCTVRQAANHMVNHHIGRLPVVRRGPKPEVVGMITRSDILSVFQRQVDEALRQNPTIRFPRIPHHTNRRGSV